LGSIGKNLQQLLEKKYWKKPATIITLTVYQYFRISLSGAAFLRFCRVLARPAKKKLGGKAFNVRVCREAVADRFPGIPGSLVETSVP
jgi:hypothetical protein